MVVVYVLFFTMDMLPWFFLVVAMFLWLFWWRS